MSKLGEVFVEILGDASPFAEDFADAVSSAADVAADELGAGLSEVGEGVVDDLTEAGEMAGDGFADGLSGATDGAFDELSDAAGDAASAVEGELSGIDIDIDADADFSGLVGDAEDAAGEIVAAFDGVGAEIEAELESASGAFDGLAGALGSVQGALGTAAGGAGLEGFARAQAPLTEQSRRLAESLGTTEDEIRDLASASANVTRPLDQVLNTMEIGRQQGIQNTEQLMDFVAAWDTVGDATGESADALAESSKVLAAFNIDDPKEAFTAFGFIQEETTTGVGEFLDSVQRVLPELGTLDLSIDEAAATMGILEREMGLTGRVARRELQGAVREADGDMNVFLDTLGITAEQFEEYNQLVGDSSGVIERNADIYGDAFTPLQRFQSGMERLAFRFSGVADVAGLVAAPLGALGPMMFGANQASQLLAGGLGGKLVGGLKAAAGGFKALGMAILTNPLFLIIAAVIAVVAILWYFRDEIMAAIGAAWDWLKESTSAVWEWLKGLWSGLVDLVSGAWQAVVDWLRGLPERIIGAMQAGFQAVWNWLTEWHPLAILYRLITGGEGQVVDAIRGFVGRAVEWFVDLKDRAIEAFVGLVTGAVEWVANLHQQVIEGVTAMVSAVLEWVADLATRFVEGVKDLVNRAIVEWVLLTVRVRQAIGEMVENAVAAALGLRDRFIEAVVAVKDGAIEKFNELVAWVRDLPRRIIEALGNVGKMLFQVGKDILQGLVDGLKSMAMAPVDAVRDVGGRMVDGARRLFRTGSPSRVFADIGEDVVGGLALGVHANMDSAIAEVERFANGVVDAGRVTAPMPESGFGTGDASRPVRPSDVAPSAAPGSGPSMQVTQNIYTVDPVKAAGEAVQGLRDVAYLNEPFRRPAGVR